MDSSANGQNRALVDPFFTLNMMCICSWKKHNHRARPTQDRPTQPCSPSTPVVALSRPVRSWQAAGAGDANGADFLSFRKYHGQSFLTFRIAWFTSFNLWRRKQQKSLFHLFLDVLGMMGNQSPQVTESGTPCVAPHRRF